MKHFTPEDYKPSEITLHIVRQIAHSFPSNTMTEEEKHLCWN